MLIIRIRGHKALITKGKGERYVLNMGRNGTVLACLVGLKGLRHKGLANIHSRMYVYAGNDKQPTPRPANLV